MPVTLKNIAEMVGVSVNTVSHALKDKPDISEKTRRRVKDAAHALGYRPNFNAQSLVMKKTYTIGLAVTESDNPVRMEFCEKLRVLLEADGYRVLAVSLEHTFDHRGTSALEELLCRHVDGIILGAVWRGPSQLILEGMLQECRKSSIPVVLFGQSDSELADCVEIDLEDSAYRLTHYLVERGVSDIVYGSMNGRERFAGYQQAMVESGLKDRIRCLELASHGMDTAYKAMGRYLDSGGTLPEGIIAANDLGALGIMAALRERGVRIPEDCSIVGMDNIAFGKYSAPPLTSIGFDNGDCAQAVWQLLKRRLEKTEEGGAARVPIRQKLVIRKSVR